MIRKAALSDAPAIARMAMEMWGGHEEKELTEEFEVLIQGRESVIFLAIADAMPIGFAQCQLRRDYVEGTDSSPVGYLEGIFVKPEYRSRGCARELLAACEDWARSLGCTEFASDCELTNAVSLRFHLALGFTEANRIICFTKPL